MNTKQLLIAGSITVALATAGCVAPGLGGGDYNARQVRGEQTVRLGTVESVRDVLLDARQQQGVGTLAGAAIGGVAGSTVGGSDRANAVGAIAGAVIGGLAGQAIEKSANDRKGIEITIRLEGGKLIAITQEKDEDFRVGDRVKILSGQGVTRVSRY